MIYTLLKIDLFRACSLGDTNQLLSLIDDGYDINTKDSQGNTCLSKACIKNKLFKFY